MLLKLLPGPSLWDEVFDREELLSEFRSLVRESGNFVCFLGGKSTGKSLIFQHLQNPKSKAS
jgi:hypothetical protein